MDVFPNSAVDVYREGSHCIFAHSEGFSIKTFEDEHHYVSAGPLWLTERFPALSKHALMKRLGATGLFTRLDEAATAVLTFYEENMR
jgi:hypothetical protein